MFEAIAKAAEIVVASRCWIGEVGGGIGDDELINNTTTNSGSNGNGNATSTTNTSSNGAGSARFNLLIPEVKSVR